MVFKKNYKMSEEHKRKIGESNKIALKKFYNENPTYKSPGGFKKGHIPPFKNKKMCKESRIKMSIARKGKTYEEFYGEVLGKIMKEKRVLQLKQRKHSQETKNKIRNSHIGLPSARRGQKLPLEHIQKIKEARKYQILPMKDTSIEIKIQNYLKELGITFFTHQYIKEIKHGYQCDILIPSMNLVIECDGNHWHNYPMDNELDIIRNKELREKGYKILRFWENEIKVMKIEYFKNKLVQMRLL